VIPADDWATYTRRPHFRALARAGPLVVVERPLGPRRRVGAAQWLHVPRRAARTERLPEPSGLCIVKPRTFIPCPPEGVYPRLRERHLRSIARQIQRVLDERRMDRPVAFLTSPMQRWAFDLGIPWRAVCFELTDDFPLYLQYPIERDARLQRETVEMIRRCDLVFATSRSLAEAFASVAGNTVWVPNTADPDDFRVDEATEILPALRGLPRPIVGFIGGVNPWIDIPLLLRIRELRPAWSFVFSASLRGPVSFLDSVEVKALVRARPGVRFLGWVPYGRLRNFLRGVDVCALFHKVGELGRTIHPNKIYQYLAAGRPVVSTPFLPEMAMFEGLVRVAATPEAFVESVEAAMADDGADARDTRVRFAREHGPQARIREKLRALAARLGKDETGRGPDPDAAV